MDSFPWKHWLLVVSVAMVVAIVTWTGLNLAKVLYADWAFLHAARILNEQQQRQAPPPPQPGK